MKGLMEKRQVGGQRHTSGVGVMLSQVAALILLSPQYNIELLGRDSFSIRVTRSTEAEMARQKRQPSFPFFLSHQHLSASLLETRASRVELQSQLQIRLEESQNKFLKRRPSKLTYFPPLPLSFLLSQAEPEPDEADAMRSKLAGKKITCRHCKGDHFTTKCPYKDTLESITGGEPSTLGGDSEFGSHLTPASNDLSNPAVAASSGGVGGGGKYVPPSMRAGAARTGERMGGPGGRREGDDAPTLRVTNLSEDAEEDDLRDMFSRFGRVTRVYIGRDRETGACKGYAFVSFEIKDHADLARQKLDGHGEFGTMCQDCSDRNMKLTPPFPPSFVGRLRQSYSFSQLVNSKSSRCLEDCVRVSFFRLYITPAIFFASFVCKSIDLFRFSLTTTKNFISLRKLHNSK